MDKIDPKFRYFEKIHASSIPDYLDAIQTIVGGNEYLKTPDWKLASTPETNYCLRIHKDRMREKETRKTEKIPAFSC
jgi:hypothetical protein